MHTTIYVHYKAYENMIGELEYLHCKDNQVDDDLDKEWRRRWSPIEQTLQSVGNKSNVASKNLNELIKKKKQLVFGVLAR